MRAVEMRRREFGARQREAMLLAILTPIEQQKRIRKLCDEGRDDHAIAALTGWDLNSVRQALGSNTPA